MNLKISINNKLHPAKKIIDLDYQIEEKQNRERLNINIGIDKKSINKDIQEGPKTVNNSLYVGNTAELQKFINKRKDSE